MTADKENTALAPRSGAREIRHRGPDYDVIIIGAGPGGLASAMLLAQSGLRVKIVERLERVGGRTSNLEVDGFKFSLGPTFFNDPPILEGIFQSVGDRLDRHVELMKLDPSHRLHFGTTGKYLDCAPNIEFMEREIAKIDPEDAKNIRPYMEMNRKKYTLLRPITQKPFRSFLDWLPALKHINLFRPWSTLEDEMKRYFKNEHVRQAFSFQSRYIGMAPFQAPSLFTVLSYLEYEPGTYHPIGGCPSLCEAMANVARRMGVDIALGEDVEEIIFEGRKAKGVRTNRGAYRSRSLVINADFARAMHRLVPDHLRRKWKNKTIAKKKFSCSTFMMYLGVEGRYDDVHHHTLFLPDDYDRNLRETHIEHTVSEDPQFYVQNASVNDPTLAPEGMSALSCMFPITNLDSKCDWDKEKHRFRALAIKQLEKVGITDLERRLRFEKITTPLDWSRSYEVHNDALPPAEPVRRPRVRLSRWWWNASRKRAADHLRVREDHVAPPHRGARNEHQLAHGALARERRAGACAPARPGVVGEETASRAP
jgi:phytoene desaturase